MQTAQRTAAGSSLSSERNRLRGKWIAQIDRFLDGSTAGSLWETDSVVTSLFSGDQQAAADRDPVLIQRQRKRARSDPSQLCLTSLSADIAVGYASYLASDELLNLALTSKLYGAPVSMRRGFWSLAEEVARQRYEAASASEKGGVPRGGERPLWLKLLHRLELYRSRCGSIICWATHWPTRKYTPETSDMLAGTCLVVRALRQRLSS